MAVTTRINARSVSLPISRRAIPRKVTTRFGSCADFRWGTNR